MTLELFIAFALVRGFKSNPSDYDIYHNECFLIWIKRTLGH